MLEIVRDTMGGHHPNVLKMATSSASEFIPIFVMDSMQLMGDTPFYEYYKPELKRNFMSNSMKNVLEALKYRTYPIQIESTSGGAKIYIGKGYIADSSDRILLVLAAKTESYSKQTGYYNFFNNANPEDWMMFISTELMTNPDYSNFYRRLHKDYIVHCYTKGIEVRIITSDKIEKNTFANELDVRFSSVAELDRHLNEEVSTLLALERNGFSDLPPITINPVTEEAVSEVLEQDSVLSQSDWDNILDVTMVVRVLNLPAWDTESMFTTSSGLTINHISGEYFTVPGISPGTNLVLGEIYVGSRTYPIFEVNRPPITTVPSTEGYLQETESISIGEETVDIVHYTDDSIIVRVEDLPHQYTNMTIQANGGTVIEPILGEPGYFRVVDGYDSSRADGDILDYVTYTLYVEGEQESVQSSIHAVRLVSAIDVDAEERERQEVEGRLPLLEDEDEDSVAMEDDPFGDDAAHYGDDESSYETVEQSIENLDEEGDEDEDLPW